MDLQPKFQRAAASSPAGERGGSAAAGWVWFTAGALSILLFSFVVLPFLQTVGGADELKAYILENNIEATGLVYTDVEAFSDAERFMSDSMAYAPTRR